MKIILIGHLVKTNPNKPNTKPVLSAVEWANLSSLVSLCPRSLSSTPIGERVACSGWDFVDKIANAAEDIWWTEVIIDSY